MRDGNWKVPTEKFFGYTKDENGNMIIDETQATIYEESSPRKFDKHRY